MAGRASRFADALTSARWFWPAAFALFLLVRIAFILIAPAPTTDAAWYFGRARDIALGLGYSENGLPTAFWPVGWPGFLGLVFRLFGASTTAGYIANLVLACGSFVLTAALARAMFRSELVARLAALLLAMYPNDAAYVAILQSEVLFTFLLLLGCWIYLMRPSILGSLICGLVFGVATLTKTQAVLIPFLLIGMGALVARGARDRRKVMARAAALVCGLAIATLPWTYRNMVSFGEPIFVSTNGGMNLLYGNNPSANGGYSPDDPLVEAARFSAADQIAADRRARALAIDWIRNNPGRFAELSILKLWQLWGIDGDAEWAFQAGSPFYDQNVALFRFARILNQLYYVFLIAGSAAAAFFLVRGRKGVRLSGAATGFLLAGYFSIVSIVIFGMPRFHYPIMPFACIYAAWALSRFASAPDAT